MKRNIFLLVFLLAAASVSAQFNDSTNYYIRHSSTGLVNITNDRNSYVLNNALRFSFYRKNVSINTNNSWIYGKQQSQQTNNDITSAVDADLYKSRRNIYYWGLVHYEKSFSLKIDNRLQTGAGIGYYVLDRTNFVIHVSDGILYERSDLSEGEGAEGDYETFRNSFRLKYRFVFNELATLEGTNFLQHSLADRKDYIIRSNTQLSVKLWKWVSLSVNVTYNKLNFTSRENFLLNYGLTLEKYF